jgi:hypothetical protein
VSEPTGFAGFAAAHNLLGAASMMMIRRLMLAAVLAAGCGSSDEIPAGVDEGALADQEPPKADVAGGWWVKNEGAIGCAQTLSGKTGPFSAFDGYTFKSTQGAKVGFDVSANRRGRLLVYGPKKNGLWGGVKLSSWTTWSAQAQAWRTTAKWTAPSDGVYFVVLGSYTQVPVAYDLTFHCDSQPHCVQYVATDDTGTSLRNFYAINVDSYADGKAALAQLAGHFVDEAITPGKCQDSTTACAEIYAPVCAADITPDTGPEPRTFGNLCEFKNAVRQAAAGSTWNGGKGHWDDGECKPTHCTAGDKSYVGTPQTCPLIRFTCDFASGFSYFSDANGCGCECKDLHWYYTCGTPVCRQDSTDPAYLAIPVCDDAAGQADGNWCTNDGDFCRPAVYSCGRLLKCQQARPVVCPISQRDKKRDIRYLDDKALAERAQELLSVKLATYQYKEAPARSPHRLGFIIEDTKSTVMVDEQREHVDLYGYASLSVAALQVQAKQLEALKAEVALLKQQLAELSSKKLARSK